MTVGLTLMGLAPNTQHSKFRNAAISAWYVHDGGIDLFCSRNYNLNVLARDYADNFALASRPCGLCLHAQTAQ